MGEARRRTQPHGFKPSPKPEPPRQHHTLALMDRRTSHVKHEDGTVETVYSDHSAKPGRYASADLKHLYFWDGVSLRHLDRRTLQPQTVADSVTS